VNTAARSSIFRVSNLLPRPPRPLDDEKVKALRVPRRTASAGVLWDCAWYLAAAYGSRDRPPRFLAASDGRLVLLLLALIFLKPGCGPTMEPGDRQARLPCAAGGRYTRQTGLALSSTASNSRSRIAPKPFCSNFPPSSRPSLPRRGQRDSAARSICRHRIVVRLAMVRSSKKFGQSMPRDRPWSR